MTTEKILNQISDGIWVNKGGLKVPNEVIEVLETKYNWFERQALFTFSKHNLPSLNGILEFFKEGELENQIEFVGTEILQCCYGANKAFNSKVYEDLESVGKLKLEAMAKTYAKPYNYKAVVEVNNILIDWKNIEEIINLKQFFPEPQDILNNCKKAEDTNKIWLGSKLNDIKVMLLKMYDDILNKFDNEKHQVIQVRNHFIEVRNKTENNFLEALKELPDDNGKIKNIFTDLLKKIKEELTKLIQQIKEAVFDKKEKRVKIQEARKKSKEDSNIIKIFNDIVNQGLKGINKLFKNGIKLFELENKRNYKEGIPGGQIIKSNYGTIVPVTNPTNLDVINVLNQIAESLLSTIVLKNVTLYEQFFESVKNTVVSIVCKRFNIPGSESARYITGALLRKVQDSLPAVFNNTGMFAGVWAFLTACAPYILLASVIMIIAINIAKKNQIGDFILILGFVSTALNTRIKSQPEPDICYARIIGDEKMDDIQTLKDGFITETNKNYDFFYALTFNNQEVSRSFDISNKTPVILPKEVALAIKEGLSNLEYMDF